ncbi:hypothetical protein WK73_18240 [Burkholderia ubonensis]|nr:hypothetical protein WK73_18240 [Burkholderia ubonensis]
MLIDETSTGSELSNSSDQHLRVVVLGDIAGRASAERSGHCLRVIVDGQNENRQCRKHDTDRLNQFGAGRSRHRYVQEQDIDLMTAELLEYVIATSCFRNDDDVGCRCQYLFDASTDDRVIVSYQRVNHRRA